MALRRPIDPIAQFMQEHDDALSELASLSRSTRSLARDGFSPEAFQNVQHALDFLNLEVCIHNHREEEALFPVLDRYVEGPTTAMREDHRLLHREFLRLKRAARRVEKSKRNVRAARELEGTAQKVVQIFVNHIHKENYILFPLVRKFLTKDALREVARRMV
jgi:iron-sulfur cluster repair protein YtfE (RIC family)